MNLRIQQYNFYKLLRLVGFPRGMLGPRKNQGVFRHGRPGETPSAVRSPDDLTGDLRRAPQRVSTPAAAATDANTINMTGCDYH